MTRLAWIACGVFCVAGGLCARGQAVSFRSDVAPILLKQCQGCHGAEKTKGAYRLDSFERLTRAGESKAAPVVAGDAAKSNLFKLITAVDEADRMPQKADALRPEQVAVVRRWIEQGAKFDGPDAAAPLASIAGGQEHPAPPDVYRLPIPVTALAFSPDGKVLAASGYNEVTLWDVATGKLVGRIKRVAERTHGLAFSPDGKWLAVAGGIPGMLGEVRVCDVASTAPGRVLERIGEVMLAVRYSPDGARLAAGGGDNAIRVFDAASGKRALLIEQHADWVMDLAYSPDGARLASASRDRSARVFDAKTGAVQVAFLGHEEPVSGVAWRADGKVVASTGKDRRIRFWEAAGEAKQVGQIGGIGAEPLKVEVMAGSIFCGTSGGSVGQYSADKRQAIRTLMGKPGDWVHCLAVDAKHSRIAAGSHGGEVRVYEAETGKLVNAFMASPGFLGKR